MLPQIVRILRHPNPRQAIARRMNPLWRIYRSRGIDDAQELERELGALIPPAQMAGLDAAVVELAAARRRQRILVIGDFDADGATSCALAVLALRAFRSPRRSTSRVPDRFEFGYGLTPEIVEVARARAPDLIVTVDSGVSSVAGVAAARPWVGGRGHRPPSRRCCAPETPMRWSIPTSDKPFPVEGAGRRGVIFLRAVGLRATCAPLAGSSAKACGTEHG